MGSFPIKCRASRPSRKRCFKINRLWHLGQGDPRPGRSLDRDLHAQPTGGAPAACRVPATAPRVQGAAGRRGTGSPCREKEAQKRGGLRPCGQDPGIGVPAPGIPVFGTDFSCHLPPPSDHYQDMGQVCAWCHDEIAGGDDRGNLGRVSHGICQPCLAAKLSTLPPVLLAKQAGPARTRRAIPALERVPFALA
jgi:hypothetical protein